MRDVDDLLKLIAQAPVPAGLADVERRVLGRIVERSESRNGSLRELPIAILTGLIFGLAGGALQTSGPSHGFLDPAVTTALAPSELLGEATSEKLL